MDTSIIRGVFAWLESLYADLVGPLPVYEAGKPLVLPPDGISKSMWFEVAWSGMWAWVLWDQFDWDHSGFMSLREFTTRWSANSMKEEFGSPVNNPKMAEYNGYFECMAYTILLFRKWDADMNGVLDLQEIGNTTVWKKGLVNEDIFYKWAVKSLLDPSGFMALLWKSFADNTPHIPPTISKMSTGGHASLLQDASAPMWETETPNVSAPNASSPIVSAPNASAPNASEQQESAPQGSSPRNNGRQDSTTHAPQSSAPQKGMPEHDTTIALTEDNFAFDIGLWLEAVHTILDSDGNNKVEASEWYAATSMGKWAVRLWCSLDADGNGHIAKHEFQAEMPSAMLIEFGGAPPSAGSALNAYLSHVALSIIIFRRLDVDLDGHLQWVEIKNGPLQMLTEKEGSRECGNVQMGVITQKGFNSIAGHVEDEPKLELHELVSLLARLFSPKSKRHLA